MFNEKLAEDSEMSQPENWADVSSVIDGVEYDTSKAILLAGDDFDDGISRQRGGRNVYLFRGENGHFKVSYSHWADEKDEIIPLSNEEAKELADCLTCWRIPKHIVFKDSLLKFVEKKQCLSEL